MSRGRLVAATLLTGLGAGAGGAGLTLLLHLVQHVAFGYTETTFLVGVQRASGTRRVLVLLLCGAVAGGGWWALRALAAPVPKVTDAVRRQGVRLPLGTVTLDACLQVVVVALGASLGREGAPRQLGAAVGLWLGERTGLAPEQRRVLLACGAGAGLAAVYDVPAGGALFTLEVLLLTVAWRPVVQAAVTAGIATVVARLVVPDEPTYDVGSLHLSGTILLWSLVAGPLLGLAAAGFLRLTDCAAGLRPRGWHLPVATVSLLGTLGLVSVAYPQLLGNGRGAAQLAFAGSLPWTTLAVLALLKPLATAACLGSGATGGRLTPALATGALLGALGGRAPWCTGARPAEFAFVGASAFLAVTLRAPLTAVVLLLELTRTGSALLLPTLVATALAVATAQALPGPSATRQTRQPPPAPTRPAPTRPAPTRPAP